MSSDWWSDEERRALILSVGGGQQERVLSPAQVANLLFRASESGATMTQMADVLHLDGTSMVGRFLSLRRLPTEVLTTVRWGRNKSHVNLTQAQEVARLPDESDQRLFASAIVGEGLSGGEARSVAQLVLRSHDSLPRALEKTLALRPLLEKRFVTLGAVTDPRVRRRLRDMNKVERDTLLGDVLPIVASGWSLSWAHFTISTETQARNAEQLEVEINSLLSKKLDEKP